MNLEELLVTEKPKLGSILSFEEKDNIISIGFNAIGLGLKSIEYGCSNCYLGKIKEYSECYPGYSTRDCTCVKKTTAVNLFIKNCSLLEELIKYNYTSYNESKISKKQLNDFSNNNDWLFIFGPPGVGKTFSAYIILFLCATEKIIFASSLQLVLEDARPDVNNEFQGLLFKKSLEADVLLLDDFGREKMSEWAMNKLFSLIDSRDKRCLKTIFTSNFDYEELSALQDSAIASRIKGNCKKIRIGGEDLRLNKK